jgi:lipopolysaccharide assembly outer membrane protein LptD (OstA)
MTISPSTSTRPRALVLALAWAACLSVGPVRAATLGAFQINAGGEQSLNLQTGETELPQGGTATDSRSGLTLTGKTISYLAGKHLKASGAMIKLSGGTLNADSAEYDVQSGMLVATGHLSYSGQGIQKLSADQVSLYIASGAVVASGHVRAASPQLSADRIVVLRGGGQVLLSGNYTLNTGGSRYLNPRPDARLLLSGRSATARPTAAALQLFQPYLK